ncbi:hypothetical protein ACFZDG_03130 [Kitasatospora xanthocidica]|uniref:hypothetical protein n=1 Tax=Kitasatospora xanthocidica TaxID=83382 RepID=UPI0036EE6534
MDPLLADRVIEALVLAGLPVAHGGHGVGVRLGAASALDGAEARGGLVALCWVPGPRLVAAAAMEQAEQAASSDRALVAGTMANALAEFLPEFGVEVVPGPVGGETRVGRVTGPGPVVGRGVVLPWSAGSRPEELGIGAEVVEAVRRAAALAGLPVADHPDAPGVVLGPCRPVDDGDDTTGLADLDWNPSRHLSVHATHATHATHAAHAAHAAQAARARTAVRNAMRHALGPVLGACGLEVSWRRPATTPYQLRAYGPAARSPVRR